jgi:RNA polymerase sigma-70 factor (ECF subfamily)
VASIPYRSEELLERTGWMRALAARLVADPGAADDVVQEAWIAALEHPPREVGEAWLARVVRNLAWKRRRGERRRADHERAAPAVEPAPGPAQTAERLELQRRVLAAIAALDEPFRTAVVERYLEGRTSAELARRLGVPEGTVRWRLSRGVEDLRARLDHDFGGREAWSVVLAPLALSSPPLAPPAAAGALALPVQTGVITVLTSSKIVLAAALVVAAAGVYWWRHEDGVRGARTASEAARVEPPAEPKVEVELASTSPSAPDEPARRAAELAAEPKRATSAAAPEPRTEAVPEFATLAMRFVDPLGAPFAGVRIARLGAEKDVVLSAADGRAEIRSSGGGEKREWNVELLASRAGSATRLLRATAMLGRTTDLGDVVLEPGAQLAGHVLDESGLALEGAEVGLAAPELGEDARDEAYARRQGTAAFDRTRTARTDASGAFVLDGVATGEVRLWAHAAGMRYGWSEPFEVRAGEDQFGLELRLAPLRATDRITGIVLDPAGEPLGGAQLVSMYAIASESGSTSTDLGEDGRFDIVLRRDARYSFLASDPEHRYADALALDVAPGTRDLELRLGEKRTFAVAVRDREGAPLEGCRFLRWVRWSRDGVEQDDSPAKELEPGLYSLDLPSLPFQLSVQRDGYLPAEFPELRPERVGARLDVLLERAPLLTGRVLAAGAPVTNARVRLHHAVSGTMLRNGFACLFLPKASSETTTDADGRFALASDVLTPVFLCAASPNWATTRLGPLDPAAAGELTLELAATGAIEGRVLLPDGADGEGVVVGINHGDGLARTLRAGPEGRFRFEHLAPGPWQVLRCAAELDPRSSTVSTLDDEQRIEWSCTVEPGRTTRFDLNLTR